MLVLVALSEQTLPPRVDYSLTDRGRDRVERLLPLMEWIALNATDILEGPAVATAV